MKQKIQLLSLIIITSLLSGCFLKSVHPLVKEENSIVVPRLEGIWDGNGERWTFARSNEYLPIKFKNADLEISFEDTGNEKAEDMNGYFVIYEEINKSKVDSSYFMGTFVELGESYYMDLYPLHIESETNLYSNHFIPIHTFARIELEGDSLEIKLFKGSWIEEQITENKVRIKHEKLENSILITASTNELQKFITKYGDMQEAYEGALFLNRSK